MNTETAHAADIAALKTELKNIALTLAEMKAAAAERERMIRGILERAQNADARVRALEAFQEGVCRANASEIEKLKAFRWRLLGGIAAVSYLSGILGQESLRLILGRIAG